MKVIVFGATWAHRLAAFMVEQLTSDEWLGQAIVVDGPGTH